MFLNSPWRTDFPTLAAFDGEGQTYLDSAATAQKPQAMISALSHYYANGSANVHRAQHLPGERSTRAFEQVREQLATWLNAASAKQIIFMRGTTEAINLPAYGLEHEFAADDELVISALDQALELLQ
jgi:cysteine sulfinate desulfinase